MNNASAETRIAKPSSPSRPKRKTSARAAWLEQTDSARLVDMWESNCEDFFEESDEIRLLDECSDPALRAMLGLPLH